MPKVELYHVITPGSNIFVKSFPLFVDAWLYVVLELPCYAKIVGPDGRWTVNPPRAN